MAQDAFDVYLNGKHIDTVFATVGSYDADEMKKSLINQRYYTALIEHKELAGWFKSDSYVRRLIQRWIRLFWKSEVAALSTWSVAHYAATNDPWCTIYRHPDSGQAGVVGNGRLAPIERYALSP